MLYIHKHIDLDDLMWVEGEHDASASLLALANAYHKAISAEYPDADIDVTFDPRTGGGGHLSVCYESDEYVAFKELIVKDNVSDITGKVWQTFDWVVR